ncbi:MAG: hypothetical protein AAFP84_14515 [Actinomycetota bacterium]
MSGPAYRTAAALERLGLRMSEPIRFRRNGTGRHVIGKVEGVEHDGAVTLRDPDGSARTLRPERVEIRRPGPKGRLRWQLVSDVAITWEQLELFEQPPAAEAPTGKRVVIRRDHPTLFDEI